MSTHSSIRTKLNEADDIRYQAINNILLNELNVAYGDGMNGTIVNKPLTLSPRQLPKEFSVQVLLAVLLDPRTKLGKGLSPLVLNDWTMRAITSNEVTVEIREVEQVLNNVAVKRDDDYEDLFDVLDVVELEPPEVREIAPNDEDIVEVRIHTEITQYRNAPILSR